MQDNPMNSGLPAPATHAPPRREMGAPEHGGLASSVGSNVVILAVLLLVGGVLLQQAKNASMIYCGKVLFAFGVPLALVWLIAKMS